MPVCKLLANQEDFEDISYEFPPMDEILIGRDPGSMHGQKPTTENSRAILKISGHYTTVSRLHTRIFYDKKQKSFVVVGLGPNGTFLNDQKLVENASAPLKDSDTIKLAAQGPVFQFRVEEKKAPATQLISAPAPAPEKELPSPQPPAETSAAKGSSWSFKAEAIMVIDVCNSTLITQRYGNHLAMEAKSRFNRIVQAATKSNGLLFQKGTGDGYFMTFPSCLDAARAAIDILTQTKGGGTATETLKSFSIRIGLNFGEVLVDADGDRHGNDVNLAFRVESTSAAAMRETKQGISKEGFPTEDRIFMTDKVFQEIKAAPELSTRMIGFFEYKGFEGMRFKIYELHPAQAGAA